MENNQSKSNSTNIISIVFRIIFALIIVGDYLYFIIWTWFPICKSNNYGFIIIFIYNFLNIMIIWTVLVTNKTDSGQVPLYWGFYLGDSDAKRRRYCLMCNVFKPERCHHCSICNRCVLNMDHHCPWINNCIGFFNRKYFIQMLFYIIFTLTFIIACNAKFIYIILKKIIHYEINRKNSLTVSLLYIFIYFLNISLLVVILLFYKFHIKMVFENKTTIETIDKKGEAFESEVN